MHPADEVKRADLQDLVPKLQRRFYAEGYVKLIAVAPELYEMFFNETDNPKKVRKLGTVPCAMGRRADTEARSAPRRTGT